ncbi:MAG: hypothetical protein ACLPX9_09690 [Rhodomicrobium sp.]
MLETAVTPCASGAISDCGKGPGCGKRRPPGKGQPGCAFRGAKMALQPIWSTDRLPAKPALGLSALSILPARPCTVTASPAIWMK